ESPSRHTPARDATPWILTAVALLTRCVTLFSPNVVVWDEFHYGRFAGAYFSRQYYLDVHPPLAKMLIAWAGHLAGTPATAFINNQAAPHARILPAIAGAFIVPVVYWILI